VSLPSQIGGLYLRIARTYVRWARSLLPLAVVVFVPLGLIHAIPVHADVTSLNLGRGFELLTAVVALMALATTGLIGEVFYTGAVAISLTHPHDGEPPSLREIAGMVNYWTLIVVDLIYGATVAVGIAAFFLPGILVFVYLGLSAPIVEIEHHGVRAALGRSWRLVRGNFWLVLAILLPIELVGDAITDFVTHLSSDLLSGSLVAEWLADTASNVVLTPFYAVAAVLLTLDLIAAREGESPRLHPGPGRV
jgi:hypothetical protein